MMYSPFATVSLVCRKVFDSSVKGGVLSGASFARMQPPVLRAHSEFWAKRSHRPAADALAALAFLQVIFQDCSKSDGALLSSNSNLCRRIGLLNQYADRNAAHLTFEDYEVALLDVVHVVAALAVIGEIVLSFDDREYSTDYFNRLDKASAAVGRSLFPTIGGSTELFSHLNVTEYASTCWRYGGDNGRHMLHRQLPYAMGWFSSGA